MAFAATARTPQEQADVLRRVPDVDVWGTTLEDILTGSHQAKGQFLQQLHQVMPQQHLAPLKSPEELAHIKAMTATEKAREKMYLSKPGEAERRAALAEAKAAEAISKNLDNARANEHRILATEARTKAQSEIAAARQDLGLAKLAELQKEFESKLKAGAFKKGGVTINVGDRVKIANSLRDAGQDVVNRVDAKVKGAEKVLLDYGHLAKMSDKDFDKEYPGIPKINGGVRPELPTRTDEDYLEGPWADKLKAAKQQQEKWDDEYRHEQKRRDEALDRRRSALTAQELLANPEFNQMKTEAKSFTDQAIDYLQSKIPAPTPAPKGKK